MQKKKISKSSIIGISEFTPDANGFRLWRSFATEEKRREWWAKATASFRPMFGKINETLPTIRRKNDGISKRLDKDRRQRIKQVGNAVVPQIVEIIGNSILKWERRN